MQQHIGESESALVSGLTLTWAAQYRILVELLSVLISLFVEEHASNFVGKSLLRRSVKSWDLLGLCKTLWLKSTGLADVVPAVANDVYCGYRFGLGLW